MHVIRNGSIRMGLMLVGAVVLGGPVVEAQDGKPDAEAQKKELKEINQRLSEVGSTLTARWKELQASEEAAAALKASKDAYDLYSKTGKSDPDIVAGQAAFAKASAELNKIIEEKLAASSEAATFQQSIDELTEKRADVAFEASIAQFKLTNHYAPWQRKLDRDPELAKLRDEATKAKDRNVALKAYSTARTARLKELPETKVMLEVIDKSKTEIAEIDKQLRTKLAGIDKIRKELRSSKDPDIVAAVKAAEAARIAINAAWKSKALTDLYAAYSKAFQAYQGTIDELVKTDDVAGPLTKERDKLNARAAVLRKLLK